MRWIFLLLQAEQNVGDINGYLLVAIATLFSSGLGGLTWFARIHMPLMVEKEEARQVLHASRSDAKDDAHLEAIAGLTEAHLIAVKEQRIECKSERESQYKLFDETLKRNEQHMTQLYQLQKQEIIALNTTLGVLSQAVQQLRQGGRQPATKPAGGSQ